VKKILKHRRSASTKQLEYFVNWKNHPQSENSWVKESNLNTMEIISDNWKNLGTTPKPINMFTVQSTQIKDNPEIQFLPNSTVLYQASPTLREIQEIQPFRRESAARSSSEGSKSVKKPRQLRVFKQLDVV
jgi:hypothetical protein